MMSTTLKHTSVAVALFIAIVVLFSPIVLYITYELANRNRIYPGVAVSDTFKRIRASTITLQFPSTDPGAQGVLTLDVSSFDIQIDAQATRERLFRIGRNETFLQNLSVKVRAYREGVLVDPVLTYDQSLVEEAVASVAATVDRSVVEPKFRLIEGRVREFQQGRNGRSVDQVLLVHRIIAAVFQPPSAGQVEPSERFVDVPVSVQEPRVTTDHLSAESMGIRQLIGRGVSTFKGSIPSRKYNVTLTASRIDGVLLSAGQTFSFNETIGDVSQETGYKEAYIIKDGRTVLGDGGGVCQDSTTLFRAVLNAGLPVVERHAHSYRVGYYEQNSPPGLDATVFAPTADFKFTNDTPAYLLVQARVDKATDTLTVELWGTSDGRTATVTKPLVRDQIPPPEDLYQDDPSILSGQVKQVDWKAWGAKVSFNYTVTRAGQIIHQKTFLSNYRPWQAVFLRGTGG